MVAPVIASCPSINDLGEIAYTRSSFPSINVHSLVRNLGGVETIIARSDVAPYLDASTNTYLPSLSLGGSAAHHTNGGGGIGRGIYIAPAGTKVYNEAVDPPLGLFITSSMNDSETVVFLGTASGVIGVYRGGLVPLIQSGDVVSGGVIQLGLERPVINNSGRVAFAATLTVGGVGIYGVYTTDDGDSVTRVGTSPVDRMSINDSGAVVYRRTLSGGAGSGIFIGRPGAIDQKIINQGDPLDGSTITDAFIWEESLNNDGQVAFVAMLADGRRGVYRADPQWLGSLSFTQKIPGCGPINGKVKLSAPAPFGGLVVTLENTNPAASVPLTVTVAKGKTTGTFAITPDVVLANATGTITASIAEQSVNRSLTVRPITVAKLTLAPAVVAGGTPSTGTVSLDCAAPHDITVALSSRTPAVARPDVPSLIFPAGETALPFGITTAPVAANKGVAIKASAFGTTKSKTLTVTP
jgi:hypothetical protein